MKLRPRTVLSPRGPETPSALGLGPKLGIAKGIMGFLMDEMGGFPNIGGTILAVPIVRIRIPCGQAVFGNNIWKY